MTRPSAFGSSQTRGRLRERIVRLVRGQPRGGTMPRSSSSTSAGGPRSSAGWPRSCDQAGVEIRGRRPLPGRPTPGPSRRSPAAGGSPGFWRASVIRARSPRPVIRSPEVLEQVCMPAQGTQLGLTGDARAGARRVLAAGGAGARGSSRARRHPRLPAHLPPLSDHDAAQGPLVGATVPASSRRSSARACVDPTTEEATRFGVWHHDAGHGSEETESLAEGSVADRISGISTRTSCAVSRWRRATGRRPWPASTTRIWPTSRRPGPPACCGRMPGRPRWRRARWRSRRARGTAIDPGSAVAPNADRATTTG